MQMELENITKGKSLYEQFSEVFDQLSVYHPNVVEMAKHFSDAPSMERALCYGPSVVMKWAKRGNGISKEAERRAEQWLANMIKHEEAPQQDQAPAHKAEESVMLVVTCSSREIAEKCERLLSVLSCEVVEI